ncbi:MAG: HEAT repeat domain-containing protein [Planctomycetes bacterium]|nr:HEAT repeat domain-containing protein [Planctomycetota bacterium]
MATLIALLLGFQDDARIADLIQQLSSERIEDRDDAARELARIGTAARLHLEKLLETEDGEVRGRASVILVKIREGERFATLGVSAAAVEAIPDLASRIFSASSETRMDVLTQISGCRLKAAGRGFHGEPLYALDRQDPATPVSGQDLGRILDGVVQGETTHELDVLLIDIVRALRCEEGVTALCRRLDFGIAGLPEEAILALGPGACDRAVPVLMDGLSSRRRVKACDVLRELARWGTPLPADRILPLLKEDDADVRQRVVEVLGYIRAEKAFDEIVALLKSPQDEVRRAAAGALGLLGRREAAAPLIATLDDEDRRVRRAAGLALARLRIRDAQPRLKALLDDEDWFTRAWAIEAVVELQDDPAATLLSFGRKEEDSRVLEAAGPLLTRMADPKHLADLKKLFAASKSRVWRADVLLAMIESGHRPSTEEERNTVFNPLWTDERKGRFLWSLNRLRDPETFERLSGITLQQRRGETTWREAVEAYVGKIRGDAQAGDEGVALYEMWRRPFRELVPRLPVALILEEGQVRAVDRAAAMKFWSDWLP